ncbi:GGDEF domain-containing protein [Agaribacterium haliotis]|uniref:GGDEF domain-containing protein n=1 Tax=Agaribacterium haliotis TaxID=2013869 RepID=UPI000BB58EDD|nr:GGDEF domain-containing protein [Agaribacterium haliotis]
MPTNFELQQRGELEQAEWRRRDTLARAMCLTVTAVVLMFGIKDLITGPLQLGLSLSAFALANILALLAYKYFQRLELFCYYISTSGAFLSIFLTANGGTDNSGIIWLAVFPSVIYNLLKVRVAAFINIALIFIICYILFFDTAFYTAGYEFYVKIAGVGALLLSSCFTFFQAREREVNAHAVNRLNNELSHIASTDDLTGLPNRRDMSLRLEFESKRVKRSGKEFAIILCDVDYFKKINDSFGHSEGDKALQAFAKLLVSRFRDTDKVGRWGGEEFLVILPNTSLRDAIDIANEVRQSICQTSLLENTPNRLVTMSAGVASSAQSDDVIELLGIADKNLYAAKDAGRNRVCPEI